MGESLVSACARLASNCARRRQLTVVVCKPLGLGLRRERWGERRIDRRGPVARLLRVCPRGRHSMSRQREAREGAVTRAGGWARGERAEGEGGKGRGYGREGEEWREEVVVDGGRGRCWLRGSFIDEGAGRRALPNDLVDASALARAGDAQPSPAPGHAGCPPGMLEPLAMPSARWKLSQAPRRSLRVGWSQLRASGPLDEAAAPRPLHVGGGARPEPAFLRRRPPGSSLSFRRLGLGDQEGPESREPSPTTFVCRPASSGLIARPCLPLLALCLGVESSGNVER